MLHFLRSGFCCNPGHPEQNNIFGLSWNIPCVCATKRRRGQKTFPRVFSDTPRCWRQLFICLVEGPERSSILVCLAAKFLWGSARLFPPSLAPNSRSFLCFGGSGGRIGGCPVG